MERLKKKYIPFEPFVVKLNTRHLSAKYAVRKITAKTKRAIPPDLSRPLNQERSNHAAATASHWTGFVKPFV